VGLVATRPTADQRGPFVSHFRLANSCLCRNS
jgi:hypothetical protein